MSMVLPGNILPVFVFYANITSVMKKDIHPTYSPKTPAKCVCGATYEVGSTKDGLEVEICSSCHPFYTGKENILDTAGRLDKFNKRRAAATKLQK